MLDHVFSVTEANETYDCPTSFSFPQISYSTELLFIDLLVILLFVEFNHFLFELNTA